MAICAPQALVDRAGQFLPLEVNRFLFSIFRFSVCRPFVAGNARGVLDRAEHCIWQKYQQTGKDQRIGGLYGGPQSEVRKLWLEVRSTALRQLRKLLYCSTAFALLLCENADETVMQECTPATPGQQVYSRLSFLSIILGYQSKIYCGAGCSHRSALPRTHDHGLEMGEDRVAMVAMKVNQQIKKKKYAATTDRMRTLNPWGLLYRWKYRMSLKEACNTITGGPLSSV
jgi:hypothetical protein